MSANTSRSIGGLSPRVRGNRGSRPRCRRKPGSIPACAGQPFICWKRLSGCKVYPRVCGATMSIHFSKCGIGGLSPRVRGNPEQKCQEGERPGSIPACAGQPFGSDAHVIHQWVYPRVCGATEVALRMPRQRRGLSPRVRGNHVIFFVVAAGIGSIPACAGQPTPTARSKSRKRVYPRVCGATGACVGVGVQLVGLSPRVRGNPSPRP